MAALEKKLESLLTQQKAQEWNLDTDLDWGSFHSQLPLLPLKGLPIPITMTPQERLALSQFLGVVVISAIGSHESILGLLKEECTKNISEPLLPLTEQFFAEESKHSAAFSRYIALFAEKIAVRIESLRKVLPSLQRNSWVTGAFLVNQRLGGNAIWNLVQTTELESIDLYRYLESAREAVEPLYLELNRLHHEEETRHISVPPLILASLNGTRSSFDRKFARVLHLVWAMRQLLRFRHLRSLQKESPFFSEVYAAFRKLSFAQKISIVQHIQLYLLSGRRLHTLLRGTSNEN